MVIQEMTEEECRAMLAGTSVARLACAHDNQPYIIPIHVDLDGEFLYCYATLGQKIEWMRQNPLVCLEIDEMSTDHQWTTVVVSGRYEELPDSRRYEVRTECRRAPLSEASRMVGACLSSACRSSPPPADPLPHSDRSDDRPARRS